MNNQSKQNKETNQETRDSERNKREDKRLDFIQNIIISFLAVFAAFLFSQTEIFSLIWQDNEYSQLFSDMNVVYKEPDLQTDTLNAPLRIVLTKTYGRYANIAFTTADEMFNPLGQLLGKALETETEYEECQFSDFLNALKYDSLYCDFLYPLPLTLLAEMMGNTTEESVVPIRYMLLTSENDASFLYLSDGDMRTYRRPLSISTEEIEETAGKYEFENAAFALDQNTLGSVNVAPLSLFLTESPSLPLLSATGGVSSLEEYLTLLHFNPRTNSRYKESNGTEVIVENGRSARIRSNGSVSYQGGGKSDLSIECAEEVPTLREAVIGCEILLNALFGNQNDAAIYLKEIEQTENNLVLRFDYQVNGIPVRLSDNGCAAEITLIGKRIEKMELRPRRYTATESISLLLPLPQALGIAGIKPSAELSISYVDNSGAKVRVEWIAS